MIDAVRASPLGELFRPGNLENQNAGNNWAKGQFRRAEHQHTSLSRARHAHGVDLLDQKFEWR
jgi:hypothetical protein